MFLVTNLSSLDVLLLVNKKLLSGKKKTHEKNEITRRKKGRCLTIFCPLYFFLLSIRKWHCTIVTIVVTTLNQQGRNEWNSWFRAERLVYWMVFCSFYFLFFSWRVNVWPWKKRKKKRVQEHFHRHYYFNEKELATHLILASFKQLYTHLSYFNDSYSYSYSSTDHWE